MERLYSVVDISILAFAISKLFLSLKNINTKDVKEQISYTSIGISLCSITILLCIINIICGIKLEHTTVPVVIIASLNIIELILFSFKLYIFKKIKKLENELDNLQQNIEDLINDVNDDIK